MGDLSQQLGDLENRWLLRHPRQVVAGLVKGQRVLDVCCGWGDWSAELAAIGCQVVGVDLSAKRIAYAQQRRTTARFECMDAAAMPFQREFDAVLISFALHVVSAALRETIWQAMLRAVRPGGRLIALDYTFPRQLTLSGRLIYAIADRDERSLLKTDPAHYHNFQEFMRSGGLRAFALARSETLERQHEYWGGLIGLAVLSA